MFPTGCKPCLARTQVYQTNRLSAKSDQVSGKGGSKSEQEEHLQQWGKSSGPQTRRQADEAVDESGQPFSSKERPHEKRWYPVINPVAFEWRIIRVKLVAHMVKCPHTKSYLNLFQEHTALYKKLPVAPV